MTGSLPDSQSRKKKTAAMNRWEEEQGDRNECDVGAVREGGAHRSLSSDLRANHFSPVGSFKAQQQLPVSDN